MADDTDPEVSASHQDPEKLVRSDVLPVANDPPVGVGDDGIPPVEGRLWRKGAHLGAQVADPVAFAFQPGDQAVGRPPSQGRQLAAMRGEQGERVRHHRAGAVGDEQPPLDVEAMAHGEPGPTVEGSDPVAFSGRIGDDQFRGIGRR